LLNGDCRRLAGGLIPVKTSLIPILIEEPDNAGIFKKSSQINARSRSCLSIHPGKFLIFVSGRHSTLEQALVLKVSRNYPAQQMPELEMQETFPAFIPDHLDRLGA
jgi:hypothetical protein